MNAASGGNVLIYVEDPGAANMIAGVGTALRATGCACNIAAAPEVADFLAERGEACDVVPAENLADYVGNARPSLVAVGTSENPESPAFALTDGARAQDLVTVGFVDGPAHAVYRFRGTGDEPLSFAPEWILTPDTATSDVFRALGHAEDKVLAVGHPALDRARAKAEELKSADRAQVRQQLYPGTAPDDFIILFLLELSHGLDPTAFIRHLDYTLRGRAMTTGRTEIILEEIIEARRNVLPESKLFLRPHPKTDMEEYAYYNGEFDGWNTSPCPLTAAFAADLTIGLSTILLYEAAAMGLPTLSVLPRDSEKVWLSSIALGLTPCVTRPGQLRSTLRSKGARLERTAPDEVIQFGATQRMAGLLGKWAQA